MANDSGLFATMRDLEARGWHLVGNRFLRREQVRLPLYEAKMVSHYNHRYADYSTGGPVGDGTQLPAVSPEILADASFVALPRYWIDSTQVDARLANRWAYPWLVGWRDVTNSTNERSFIPVVIPRVAVGHKLPLLLANVDPVFQAALVGLLSSLAIDYVARQKIGGTSAAIFIVEQLPLPTPAMLEISPGQPRRVTKWLADQVASLVYVSDDLEAFGRALGRTRPARYDPSTRLAIRAKLDGVIFAMAGLARTDVCHVLESFGVLARREERQFGAFRTAEMVLGAFDTITGGSEHVALDEVEDRLSLLGTL